MSAHTDKFGGGMLANGSLNVVQNGQNHREIDLSAQGGQAMAGLMNQGQITIDNEGAGNGHSIVISGKDGMLGEFLKSGSITIADDDHGHETITLQGSGSKVGTIVIDSAHPGSFTQVFNNHVTMQVVNDGLGHEDIVFHTDKNETLIIDNDAGHQSLQYSSSMGSITIANDENGVQGIAMAATTDKSGALLIENDPHGQQGVIMSYVDHDTSELWLVGGDSRADEQALFAGIKNNDATLLMLQAAASGSLQMLLATTKPFDIDLIASRI
jgi:hypothetical protein